MTAARGSCHEQFAPGPSEPIRRTKTPPLELEIAPLRLPAELRQFWARVDPRALRVLPYPRITSPEFALESWEEARGMERLPLALVLVGYQSHECMAVELDDVSFTLSQEMIWTRREELGGLGVRLTACSVDQEANVVQVRVLAADVERAREALVSHIAAVHVAAGQYGRRLESEL